MTIESVNLPLGRTDSQDGRPELIPRDYVMLSLTDTGTSRSTAVNMRLARALHNVGQPTSKTATTPASMFDVIWKSGGDIVRFNGHGPGTKISVFLPRCGKQAAVNNTLHW